MQQGVSSNAFLKPWQIWWMACRPRTLPVSLPPIFVGTSLAYHESHSIQWQLSFFVLFCSLCLQIGVNLINDALDFKKGADTDQRLGPKRVTQGGLIPYETVLRVGIICLFVAFLGSIPLIIAGGMPFVFIILSAMACSYLYTGGPYPLAYRGLGELFVFIFFGLVSTMAVYFLQTSSLNLAIFLGAIQVGLLAVVPCAINNLRDHVTDQIANKKTLAVRFGVLFGRIEITALSIIPFAIAIFWVLKNQPAIALLPFFCLPRIFKNVYAVWVTEPSVAYNQFLAESAKCQLIFACLLAFGCFYYAN